jgi:arylsulfatase A-like enzyme
MPPYVYVENDMPTAVPDHITSSTGKQFWREGPTAPDFVHEQTLPNFTSRACEYICSNADKDKPFFLYLPLPAPHTPILPTEEFRGKTNTNDYGDFCLMVDKLVGDVREAISSSGISENTILIFTSDNGCSPEADFEELKECGHNPSYVFRGHKADIYEGGHRIPLIIEWPKIISGGEECSEIVCLSDFIATVAEILNIKLQPDSAEDSVSNYSLWKNPDSGAVRKDIVHHSINGSFSLRRGNWKLELCPGSGGWSYPKPGEEEPDAPSMQLYNLDNDISERKNLITENPEIVQELQDTLTKYIKEGRSTPGPIQKNTGPLLWPQLNWMIAE